MGAQRGHTPDRLIWSCWGSPATSSTVGSLRRCVTSSRRAWCACSTCCSSTRTRTARSGRSSWRDLGSELEPAFIDIDGQLAGGLLDPEDVEEVAKELDPDSSIAVIAIENLWVVPFIDAVRASGGELIDQARVPSAVVAEVRDALEQDS